MLTDKAMTKEFTELQLFNITDGRLSTEIKDVYDILNHVCDTSLMTHELPVAMRYLEFKNPAWYILGKETIEYFKKQTGSNDFKELTQAIKVSGNHVTAIPQLKDEFDTDDFEAFMLENSLI